MNHSLSRVVLGISQSAGLVLSAQAAYGGTSCVGTRECVPALCWNAMSTCFSPKLTGPAYARTKWMGPQLSLDWVVSVFDGNDPVLGRIHNSNAGATPASCYDPLPSRRDRCLHDR